MKKITFLLILILGMFTAQAQADISNGFYYGIEYSQMDTDLTIPDVTSVTGTANPKPSLDTFIFRTGYYFTNFLAVEVHLGTSLSEKNKIGTTSAKANNLIGGFIRGNLPLREQNVNLYALLGASRIEMKLVAPPLNATSTGKTTITGTGISYAFGIELYATPTTALNIEYNRYLSESAATVNSVSIGFINHFSLPKLF